MQNRPVWFLGVARALAAMPSGSDFRRRAETIFPARSDAESRDRETRRALPDPTRCATRLRASRLLWQEATPTASPAEAEVESVVVSATRFDIPLDQSPATVSVISSEDIEQKQIQRVSNALREVPGLSVVQTGTAGQLTSVFMRGLPSEDMQVLLDGIPINQGLSGAMNFADYHDGRYRQDRGRARAAKRDLRTARTRRSDSNLHETRHRNSGRNGCCRGRIVRLFPRMGPERRQNRRFRLFGRRQSARHRQRASQ